MSNIGAINFRITINPFFWIIIIGAIITGQFIEIITLFTVVIIHELGHVFVAKSYGWSIREIQLLPFGGVANMMQKNDSIWEEFIVAISGPMQNFFMVLIALGLLKINLWSEEWTTFFIKANIIIGLFNLLPISPLDGNKILKSILCFFFSYKKTLTYSIFISIILNIFLILWACGLLYTEQVNINGMILGIFFIVITLSEIKQLPYLYWQFLLKKSDLMPLRGVPAILIIVNKDTIIMSALKLLKRERYHMFYILSDKGEVLKILPEERLLRCIYNKNELYQPISQLIK